MNRKRHYILFSLILFTITFSNLYGQRLSNYQAKSIINTLTKSINEHDTATFRKLWFVNYLVNYSDCNRPRDNGPPYLPCQCVFPSTDNEITKEFIKIEKLISTATTKNHKTNIRVTKLPKQYKSNYGLTHKIIYSISDTNFKYVINFYMKKKDSKWLIMTTPEIE